MKSIRYCALDVHKSFCELAVVGKDGRVVGVEQNHGRAGRFIRLFGVVD
jgi:hypothetical protein